MFYSFGNVYNTGNGGIRKSSFYGMVGTFCTCLLLFLLMWFYVMPYSNISQPVEEEGLMISFGDNENAGGMGSSTEPLAAPEKEIITKEAPVVQKTAPAPKEQVLTQNNEDNVILLQKQKEQKIQKGRQQAEQRKLDMEMQQAVQRQKMQQEAINKANATVNGLFANGSMRSGSGNGAGSGNGTGTGSGNGSEAGVQGNPAGHGNLGGNSWSLNGRSLSGRLVSPSYDNNVEGKVTVSIRVDENGRVVSAGVVSPTTISDTETRNAALTAARNTRFSSGAGMVSGIIVYNFKLR